MPPTDEKRNTTDSSTANDLAPTETNSQPGSVQRRGVPQTPTTAEPKGGDEKTDPTAPAKGS